MIYKMQGQGGRGNQRRSRGSISSRSVIRLVQVHVFLHAYFLWCCLRVFSCLFSFLPVPDGCLRPKSYNGFYLVKNYEISIFFMWNMLIILFLFTVPSLFHNIGKTWQHLFCIFFMSPPKYISFLLHLNIKFVMFSSNVVNMIVLFISLLCFYHHLIDTY